MGTPFMWVGGTTRIPLLGSGLGEKTSGVSLIIEDGDKYLIQRADAVTRRSGIRSPGTGPRM